MGSDKCLKRIVVAKLHHAMLSFLTPPTVGSLRLIHGPCQQEIMSLVREEQEPFELMVEIEVEHPRCYLVVRDSNRR